MPRVDVEMFSKVRQYWYYDEVGEPSEPHSWPAVKETEQGNFVAKVCQGAKGLGLLPVNHKAQGMICFLDDEPEYDRIDHFCVVNIANTNNACFLRPVFKTPSQLAREKGEE